MFQRRGINAIGVYRTLCAIGTQIYGDGGIHATANEKFMENKN
jgi:hypothetical protein